MTCAPSSCVIPSVQLLTVAQSGFLTSGGNNLDCLPFCAASRRLSTPKRPKRLAVRVSRTIYVTAQSIASAHLTRYLFGFRKLVM